jgi:tRNA nucleotidyltransferase/poly(A) polymerase
MGEFQTIATERIWGEWEKFFQKGTHPHMGLKFLRDTGWIGFFPEVENLIGTVQERLAPGRRRVDAHKLCHASDGAHCRARRPEGR